MKLRAMVILCLMLVCSCVMAGGDEPQNQLPPCPATTSCPSPCPVPQQICPPASNSAASSAAMSAPTPQLETTDAMSSPNHKIAENASFRKMDPYGSVRENRAAIEIIDQMIQSFAHGEAPNLRNYRIGDYEDAIDALQENPQTFADFATEIDCESLGQFTVRRVNNLVPMELQITRRGFDGLVWNTRMMIGRIMYSRDESPVEQSMIPTQCEGAIQLTDDEMKNIHGPVASPEEIDKIKKGLAAEKSK